MVVRMIGCILVTGCAFGGELDPPRLVASWSLFVGFFLSSYLSSYYCVVTGRQEEEEEEEEEEEQEEGKHLNHI